MNDLDTIVGDHSDAVWRTVYRLLNNREDALECYQETFLDALRVSDCEDVRHWRTMLQRIATRRAIDRLRRRYRDENALTDLHLCSYHRSAGELPDARVLAEELREQVRRALTKLPLQQAEAFWLRHIERRNSDEIAELMGVETGHARVLVHRAAIRLRTLLGPIYGSELVPDEMS